MYTPNIGDSGIFKLQEPFAALVTPQVVYTCRSIRTINDLIASGVSAYERYYASLGVSQSVFLEDAANNVCIIGLQAGSGEWIYVPNTFIIEPPSTTGVKYSSIILGVGLGAIPDQLNIEPLITKIKELVEANLGIEPTVKAALVSQPAFIDHDKHERLESVRKSKIESNETDYTKVVKLKAQVDTLNERISELESYIRNVI